MKKKKTKTNIQTKKPLKKTPHPLKKPPTTRQTNNNFNVTKKYLKYTYKQ